jgi:hypothetical protein
LFVEVRLQQRLQVGGFWADLKAVDPFRKAGVFRPGFGAATVIDKDTATPDATTSLIRYLVKSKAVGGGRVFYGLSSTKAFRVVVGSSTTDAPISLAFASAQDIRGAAAYKIANGNDALFYAFDTDIGMYDQTLTFNEEASWDHNFMSTIPTGASTLSNSSTVHPLYHFKKTDILYIGAENIIDQFDANVGANGTLTKNALDLPKGLQIVDISQLGDYLAILAVTKRDLYVKPTSHVFFWDTYSSSWTYDYEIQDHVRKLVFDRGKLYAIGEGDGLNVYQLYLREAVLKESFTGTIALDAQRRDGNDEGTGTMAAASNGLILIGALHDNNFHIFNYGHKKAGIPFSLGKMLYVRTAVGTIDIGDILFMKPDRIYLSWQDDNGAAADDYNLTRFSSLDGSQAGSYGDTVELDNYFGGSGRLKTLKKIRVEFDPLASGEYFSLYYTKDYGTSYRYIVDNTAASTRISNNTASTIQVGSATSYEFLNSEIGLFRQLNLRLFSESGDVKIRKVIIYWDYADT